MNLQFAVADYYNFLEVSAIALAILILVSAVDDLFVDLWYWCRLAYRKIFIRNKYKKLTSDELLNTSEKPLAIMIPAWLEFDVIAPMLENMVETIDYKNYMIFVGTYVNDEKTKREVERMRRRYKHLVRVEVPHAGPTCKADCLNWIVQAIFKQDLTQEEKFAGVILHDSEDVLHPLELKYFNYLLPKIDFIQLPVTSLERKWREFVAGTYMDEFAEWHTKDLVVRESMTKMVPSAGVGTCFSSKALYELASENNNQPFNTDTLTEDYDIGNRLHKKGMKQIFGKFPVEYVVKRKSIFGVNRDKLKILRMPLGIREYFPNDFRSAYRQKARWVLGICLQGWSQVGWDGDLAAKYSLYRDRKGLVTSFLSIFGYFLLLNFLIYFIADKSGIISIYKPTILFGNPIAEGLLALNVIALFLRIIQRFWFVYRIYGVTHAFLSIPRMVVGNFINAMATARAWKLFLIHKFTGKPLVWDKTMHDFPSAEQLVQQRMMLGELLLTWKAVNPEHLEKALEIQKSDSRHLGQILSVNGWIEEDTLQEAIDYQRNVDANTTNQSKALLAK